MKDWVGPVVGLIVAIVLIILYFRSSSGFANEPGQTPTDVIPTQLPQVPPTPPISVPEPSPVLPQPIPDVQATATESDFPESLSMSSFVVSSDLSEMDVPMSEMPKLVKMQGPEDIEMDRRQTYSEWSQ